MTGILPLLLAYCLITFGSCSINRLAVRAASGALEGASSGSTNAFVTDDDPELVGQSLPTMIKLGESLLAADPKNPALGKSVGSLYIMYANAFIEGPALLLPPPRYDEKVAARARALSLYNRGASYLRAAIENMHRGLFQRLEAGEAIGPSLKTLKKEDVPYLYWYSAGSAAAFALDPLDVSAAARVPIILAMVRRASELDPGFSNGAIHELSISLYGGLPRDIGGSPEKAKEAFAKAVDAAKGMTASPYVAYAVSLAIPSQDLATFTDMLNKALSIDPQAYPPARLVNVLSQRKARWYLDHAGDYFDIATE